MTETTGRPGLTPGSPEAAAYKWVLDNPPGLDPVCGDNGYPTEIELQRIEHWFDDPQTPDWNERLLNLLVYVRERWNYREWGWKEATDKDGTVFYSISTGGWSGNEDLIGALRACFVAWMLIFDTHRAGGHYVLRFKPMKKEADAKTQGTNGG